MGAFDGVAPPTSSSASKLINKPSYDVFINHRGPDVKSTLASALYAILTGMALSVFLDSPELECGDFFPGTIEAAISSALVHIAIFSERYAQSPWCLAELSFMLESGATIIPVFYHVDPSDLRWVGQGKGIYAKAFQDHEQKDRYRPEKLQEWKDTLYKVSFYSGEIIRNGDDEMKLLPNIVNRVLKEKKNVPLMVAKHPVGLKEIVQDFENNTLRSAGGDQDVRIVGIWGMGGSGKTTLAQELYNKFSSSMNRCSFIFDVRDGAAKGLLQNKQIQLLNNLGVKNETFDNIELGKAILATHLRSVRVLCVFDDVDHKDQLDSLLPVKDSLGRGSLIIVTSREFEVLRSWGIFSVHKMKPLDLSFGVQLFCRHAFSQSYPSKGFEELVKKFVNVCNGLPLSLKVFGGQVYGEFRKEYWESLLHKISRILPDDIKNRFKVSYDALDYEEKEMFLDTACFFIGEENSLAIEVWNGLGWSGLYSWERLKNKCLVELDKKNHISMHDHLRDLGREIVNQCSPYRIWLSNQIIDAYKQIKKINAIRGIRMDRSWYPGVKEYVLDVGVHRSLMPLSLAPSFVGLKILVIRGDFWNKKEIGEISRELVWLRWSKISQRNLPSRLSLKNLRVLELHGAPHLEELWVANNDAPVHLRELVISDCFKFQRFPNSIRFLTELKKIVIKPVYERRSLLLKSLPSRFGDLRNLRYLDISNCHYLTGLPVSFRKLMLLQHLNLSYCKQLMLTSEDFQYITKLEYLNLSSCKQVEDLPRHITDQASLTELYLDRMESLRELPINIGQLSKLPKMEIGSKMLKGLPSSLGDLSSLTHLSITDCDKLKCSLTVERLVHLEHFTITQCPISQVDFGVAPSNLKEIKLSGTEVRKISISEDRFPRLERLQLCNNIDLVEIEALPVNLQWLMIYECPGLDKLPSFTSLTSLRELQLEHCGPIEKIEGLEYCTRLEILGLESNWQMPASLKAMEKLRRLKLKANEGSDIARCIQTIQKWPDEIMILSRAVPGAASLFDFKSKQILDSEGIPKNFCNRNAILLWSVINFVFPGNINLVCDEWETDKFGTMQGEWVCIVFCTQRSKHELLTASVVGIGYLECEWESPYCEWAVKGEGEDRLFVRRGEEQRLAAAFTAYCNLL